MLSGIILICSKQQNTQYNEKKRMIFNTAWHEFQQTHKFFMHIHTYIYVRESGHIIIDVS